VPNEPPTIAILYMTCDDFDEEACLSCLNQDYDHVKLYICDDSRSSLFIERIQRFVEAYPSCERIVRRDRKGFKAGNINHALRHHVRTEWFLLVDADQRLPGNFVSLLRAVIPSNGRDAPLFIQGAHSAFPAKDCTAFQSALGPEVELFYQRDLVLRERFGFVPLLGHGALIQRKACLDLGGFPEVVSEDFAFALRAARVGKRGTYVPHVESWEAYPHDLGAFLTRLNKFSGGSAELIRKELGPFFLSPVSWVEKWDFTMAMAWYVLMPCLLVNGFLSAYVVHILWRGELNYLHPWLPYLYTWLLIALVGLCVSVTRTGKQAVRFFFWSTAVYTAALPVCSWAFTKHLFLSPKFERTPKGREPTTVRFHELVLAGCFGVLALALAMSWWSPFSPILLGQGVAFLSLGLYMRLSSMSSLGRLARLLVYLPGFLYLTGLYAVWAWAKA